MMTLILIEEPSFYFWISEPIEIIAKCCLEGCLNVGDLSSYLYVFMFRSFLFVNITSFYFLM